MNEETLRKSIEPKSDQMNADDLIVGPLTVTVRDVVAGQSHEQPVQIVLDGHRPYRPCKSMRRVLIAAWGDMGKEWIGRSMTLYCDPTIKFGGVAVGGVRISHMSHMESDLALMLTTTRSRRSMFRVSILKGHAPATYPQVSFEANVGAWVQAIAGGRLTVQALASKVAGVGKGLLTSEQLADLERRVAAATKGAEGSARAAQGAQDAQAEHEAGYPVATADELADRVAHAQKPAELKEIETIANSLKDPAERDAILAIIMRRRTGMAEQCA